MKLIGRPVPSSQVLQEKRAQRLTEANSKARLLRSRLLLDKFSDTDSDFIFFTDEKVFHVASPVNMQNIECILLTELFLSVTAYVIVPLCGLSYVIIKRIYVYMCTT